jgi:hypothetical protein
MNLKLLAACGVLLALLPLSMLVAREPFAYQSGQLTEMNSVACGMEEKSGQGFMAELSGSDMNQRTTRALLCPEYVIETEKVSFRVRPRDEKRPVLLPVGETVRFRLERDRMLLRLADADEKEREYDVISMKARNASPTAPVLPDATAH